MTRRQWAVGQQAGFVRRRPLILLLALILELCSCNMRPEDPQAGAVIIGNTGSVSGRVIVSASSLAKRIAFADSANSAAHIYLLRSRDSVTLDSTRTDSVGFWHFDSLAVDTYAVRAELSNGRSLLNQNVVVQAGKTVRLEENFGLALAVGSTNYQGPAFVAGMGSAEITSMPGYNGGVWYGFSDTSASGGASYAQPSLASAFMTMAQGTPGTIQATLQLRPGVAQPFAGVGFDWSSPKQGVNLLPADGLCVTYRASTPVWLELPMNGIGYANQPGYVLPASTSLRTQSLQWSDFQWQSVRTDSLTILDAVANAESLNFMARSHDIGVDSVDVNIEIQSVYLGRANCL